MIKPVAPPITGGASIMIHLPAPCLSPSKSMAVGPKTLGPSTIRRTFVTAPFQPHSLLATWEASHSFRGKICSAFRRTSFHIVVVSKSSMLCQIMFHHDVVA
ncbi:hypothetical protein AVEN_38755-1 [Araneus ventricosus]|uniref:Uncharacterized protein n=1 Tax=Araneus ventricosus TaxID=182803 RepID=A0A4Y2PLD1_ARAVE|nr:hypothetical protein AVEN_38755-1 [Araneus ventricosus]